MTRTSDIENSNYLNIYVDQAKEMLADKKYEEF